MTDVPEKGHDPEVSKTLPGEAGMARKSLSTLVDDIYHVLAETTDHEVSEANVEAAGESLKTLLRSRFKRREIRKGEDVLRFSAIGKKDRVLWYEANMPEVAETMPGKQMLKFLIGDLYELVVLFLAKEAGHEVTHEQYEVSTNGVNGHVDAVIDGVPVDVKSASPYGYQKFATGDFVFDDPFGYIPQLSGYAHRLRDEQGISPAAPNPPAAFLVADKVDGSLCVAEMDKETVEGNRPEPRIEHLRLAITSDVPPARCYDPVPEGKSGNLKLGIGCSYCKFKDECWKDANGGQGLRKFFYSRGPVWLTKVAKEPKVDESA